MSNHKNHVPQGDTGLVWMLAALVLVLFLISLLVGSCVGEARGETIRVDKFRGLATDVKPHALGWTQARKSVGWVYLDGKLERETFDQLNAGTGSIQPITIVGEWSPQNKILIYSGGLYLYLIDADETITIGTLFEDTVAIVNGDSTVTRVRMKPGWLNAVLTNRGANNTVIINDTVRSILHVYSDSVFVLLSSCDLGTDASASFEVVSGLAIDADNVHSFETDDTTWVFDGNLMFAYTDGVSFTFDWPQYADSGTIDSLWIDTTSAPNSGDSCFVYASNFNDSHEGKYVLWNDTLVSMRAIPAYILRVDTIGGLPRALLITDTANYVGENHFGENHRFIIADLSFAYNGAFNFVTPTFDSLGTYGNIKIYTMVLRNVATAWHYARSLDAASYYFKPWNPALGIYDDTAMHRVYLKQLAYYSDGDSATFLLWCHKTASLYGYNNLCDIDDPGCRESTILYKHIPPQFSQSGNSVSWPYSIGALHRRRAWYAGNDTGVTIWAWSDQAHYNTIVGSEKLEGSSPITSIISAGQEVTAIRENQSVIRGPIAGTILDNSESISGFSEDDFYKTPIQAILSGNFTLSPLGLGMFQSGSIRPIPTNCNTIWSDSINWDAGERIVAAIYQGRLWLGVPFGTSATNNRCIVIDPSTEPVTLGFVGAMKPGSFLVRRAGDRDEQLYIGQADSSYLWLAGGTADRYEMADWRSGWGDGGDPSQIKRANWYNVTFFGTSGDTLIVDIYSNLSETVVWSDTTVATGGSQSLYVPIGTVVTQGYYLAYGFRSPDDMTITGWQWGIEPLVTRGGQ